MHPTNTPPISTFILILVPAVSGLVGAVIGGLISAISNWIIRKKETLLRIHEKLFEKRIHAYEELLLIPQTLRTTVFANCRDSEGNALSYPIFLTNKDEFDSFKMLYYKSYNYNTHWIDIEVKRELNYIQDYITTLEAYLTQANPDYIELGIKIKTDIIEMAANIEKLILEFLNEDIYKIHLKPTQGHHKYHLAITNERLNNTKLMQIVRNFDFK